MASSIRILLTGGGSGGHVYPLLAVAEALEKSAIEKKLLMEIHYLGPKDRWSEILSNARIKIHSISSGKIRRYASLTNFLDIPKFFIGLIQSFSRLYWLMPDAIFSKGGPGALPVVLAGWFYRIPIMVHESDATPGVTNLASSWFATRIAVSFESCLKYFHPQKVALTGNPVRRDLLGDRITTERAKEEFNFDPKEPLTLVLGGSQGSQRINEFVILTLKDLIKETQLLHQVGQENYLEMKKFSQAALLNVPLESELKSRYQVVPYLEKEMKTALTAADLVVARAGSGTIFEIAAFGKPALLIPLAESANDHQRLNAYEFARSGGAVVMEEANLSSGIFLSQVRSILKDKTAAATMATASAKFFKPQAAETIAEEILNIA